MAQEIFGEALTRSYKPSVAGVQPEMESLGVGFPIKNPEAFERLPGLPLPALDGSNIAEHFKNISKGLLGEKVKVMRGFANAAVAEPPTEFVYEKGWVRYGFDGVVEILGDKGLAGVPIAIFDCETFVKGSDFGHPILATAVSPDSYYVWMHECFVDSTIPYTPQMVPLGTNNSVLIAHNSGFDRQRTVEAYNIEYNPFDLNNPRGNLWFDTMSAHINVSGLASEQRFWYKEEDTDSYKAAAPPAWADKGCMNNLVDCYNFHCHPMVKLEKSSKDTRNIFVDANTISEFHGNREELVAYALSDVWRTFELYSILAVKYLQANPSLTTLFGHFTQSSAILPVTDGWYEWVKGCEKVWENSIKRQDELLSEMAVQLLEDWKNDEVDVENDPWLSQLDWTASYQLTKAGKPRSVWYGVPAWYRGNAERDKETGEIRLLPISTKTRLSHLLLRLKWLDSPIFYIRDSGWTYTDHKGARVKIPHAKKEGENVGGVLSNDYLPEFESGVLSSDLPQAQELIDLAVKVSYWTSVRSRVKKQYATKSNDSNLTVIVPQTVPHNTATNRAGENLWLTVPDPRPHKIGTEVKTRVQIKSPYTFVSSDYDGQESVVASIFADSHYKISGSTAFGYAVLAGSKDEGTDMHSVTASTININRSIAKECNYGMLYGSGVKTLASTIRKGNRSVSVEQAKELAKKLIAAKKGKKTHPQSPYYWGGTDSFAYNEMSRMANSDSPVNPLSGSKMSTAFRPSAVGKDFFTMRNNWVIQSTGSALLHAFQTGLMYLLNKYGISARFCMSVHDSVLYMCREEDGDRVAVLFQIAHLWSWAWLRSNYGIYEMPHANAWFSSIEIDKIFRKSATTSTLTVSQDLPEPDGRAHTITSLIPTWRAMVQE